MRGVVHFLSPQATTSLSTSVSMVSPLKLRNGIVSLFFRRHSTRFFCKYSEYSRVALDYNDAFTKRMEMDGLKPHNRIDQRLPIVIGPMVVEISVTWKKQLVIWGIRFSKMFASGTRLVLCSLLIMQMIRPKRLITQIQRTLSQT